ncbi:MAG: cytosine deaminase, partial [Bifidobacterium tsurumiense]|nr:cytosine deaminase [Bifidobacterium tsurumiense]
MFHDPLYAAAHPIPLDQVILYSAPMVIPITGPVIIDGAVAVSRGRVVHVGTRRWVLEALQQDM